jgi:hypothetical protein
VLSLSHGAVSPLTLPKPVELRVSTRDPANPLKVCTNFGKLIIFLDTKQKRLSISNGTNTSKLKKKRVKKTSMHLYIISNLIFCEG